MNWSTRDLDKINAFCKETMMEHLEIVFVAITETELIAEMPVDHRTHQPMKLLHGGANVVLVETIGSMGSALLCDLSTEAPVGIEVSANHIRSVSSGKVRAVGKALHIGRSTHLWQIDIYSVPENKLLSTGKITNFIKKLN